MGDRQQGVLRLHPHMIPAVRASFARAVNHINDTVSGLHRAGYLTDPWLGDETSQDVAIYYTRRAMDAPDSSYQSLVAYRDELARIHDAIQQMEDHYRRTEGDNAALWGRKA